jgi:hypothetical protein
MKKRKKRISHSCSPPQPSRVHEVLGMDEKEPLLGMDSTVLNINHNLYPSNNNLYPSNNNLYPSNNNLYPSNNNLYPSNIESASLESHQKSRKTRAVSAYATPRVS